MGANQSTVDNGPKVFHPETSIEVSADVVNNLSARLVALHAEEETVQLEIHRALEKENLDRETSMTEDSSAHGGLKTGIALIGDLEEIREQVDRFQTRRQLEEFPSVRETGEAVGTCYKVNVTQPLECWRQVARFKAAVADAENRYLASLR